MSHAELTHLELLAELDTLVESIKRWVELPLKWEAALPIRAMVRRLTQRLGAMRIRLEAPIVLGVLGGTGVGKSALVNALAGAEVVETGRARPTTGRPILICRPDWTPELLGIDPASVEVVHRDLPSLAHLVLVDCPDPDTTEVADVPGTNLARLRQILPHCDALLVVTTQQKYRSARVADELAAAAPGARLVFVQTHADVDGDIREDWRPLIEARYGPSPIFRVDSLSALADAQKGVEPRGEFAALVDLLTRQLAGSAAARIRRANLLDLVEQTLAACRRRVDEALPAVRQLEEALRRISDRTKIPTGEPLIKNLYTLVGSTISDTRPATGSHVGAVRAELADVAVRGITTDELSALWEKEVGVMPGVLALTISGLQTGPPGAPIEIWIQGEDMRAMLKASEVLQNKLRTYEGLYQVKQDFRPGKNEFRLKLRPEARTFGLTVSELARQINAGYFGEEAVRIQRGRDDIRVRVRYPEEERQRVDYFERVRIRTPQGQEVPLLSVAEIEFGPGYASINRTNGLRRISVTSEVNYAVSSPSEIMNDLEQNFMPDLRKQFPDLFFSFQGDKRKTTESLGSLFYSYPVALLVIYIIIAAIFRSYFQPLLIMITIPFGIVGAILGHLIMGYDMTMMSIFGIVALSGIVVNDAIVLIERFNHNIIDRIPFLESIYQAGSRRLMAIFLTTATTVGGLAPLMLERSFQAKFLIPMAISLSFGLLFATLLTLLFIPVLLVILNDIKRGLRFLLTGVMPPPEEVESAIRRRIESSELSSGISTGIASDGNGPLPVTEGISS